MFQIKAGLQRFSKCGSSRKLVILWSVGKRSCFGAKSNDSVVCSIVLSKSIKPFMPY